MPSSSHIGHRQRLQDRFLKAEPHSFPDYELLELILMRCIPRQDVKPLAKSLLKHFFSFAGVLHANPNELRQFKGVKDSTIAMFKLILESNRYLLMEDLKRRPILAHWETVCDYCKLAIGHEPVERYLVFYLDTGMHLLRQELSTVGTNNQVHLYPREILKRALELNATNIILAHNHPSGSLDPSHNDIRLTRELRRILMANDIRLADHLIVSGNQQPKSLNNMPVGNLNDPY